jgi:WD40 repeat protein
MTEGRAVNFLAFSRDGRYLAAGSEDKTARVMEVVSGKELWRLTEEGSVVALVLSPDGRHLATGAADGTVRVLGVLSGKEVSRMIVSGTVLAIAYSADSRMLTTASYTSSSDSEIIISSHLVDATDMIADACSRITRNLTQEEWNQYVGPEAPYHKTCSRLP